LQNDLYIPRLQNEVMKTVCQKEMEIWQSLVPENIKFNFIRFHYAMHNGQCARVA